MKIYIMSPKKHKIRRDSMVSSLEQTGFEFEFMSINDDLELTPEAILKNHNTQKTRDTFGREFSRGEIASTLNHLLAYKKIIESRDDTAIILEDDMSFNGKEFYRIVSLASKLVNTSQPQVCLLTPVISYLKHNAIKITNKHKIVSVVQAWDAGYIINQSAAKKMVEINKESWILADDWVKYKRYADINVLSVVPPITKQDTRFDSNLLTDRKKSNRNNKTFKYIISRNKYKIMADLKKFFYLYPFRGYIRNKNV